MQSEVLSVHHRTLSGLRKLIDRTMPHVHGLERTIVKRGVQMLLPRIEQRIRAASEEDLLVELRFLHELIGEILNEKSKKDTKRCKSRKNKHSRLRPTTRRKPIANG